MNASLLIHLIVQQTTVLIAQLATSAGLRAPLASVANQVFLSLASELEAQGVRQKVVADMFGLALRTYQKKVRRLSESATDQNRSLWQAVLDYLRERPIVSRAELMRRFRFDDDAVLRGILRDLVDSGLLFQTGSGDHAAYRAATPEDLDALTGGPESAMTLLWVLIYRNGPLTRHAIETQIKLEGDVLDSYLSQLETDGRVKQNAAGAWEGTSYVIGLDNTEGWEAAVFDHYQALVSTIMQRLSVAARQASLKDRVGGSIYTFDIWEEHPERERILSLLEQVRSAAREAREAAMATGVPEGADTTRVTFYVGQNIKGGLDTDEER